MDRYLKATCPPPAARHAWICTVDHIGDGERVDTTGPHDAPDELIVRLYNGEGTHWRTLDVDDAVYHEGRYLALDGAAGDAEMSPLDDLSKPDAGAITIQVRATTDDPWVEV